MELTNESINQMFDNNLNKMSEEYFYKYIRNLIMLSKFDVKAFKNEFVEIIDKRNLINKVMVNLKANCKNKTLQEIEEKVIELKPAIKMSLKQYSLAYKLLQETVVKSENKKLINECYDLLSKSKKKQANLFFNKKYIEIFNEYLKDLKKSLPDSKVNSYIAKMKKLAKLDPYEFISEFFTIEGLYRIGGIEKLIKDLIKNFEVKKYTKNDIQDALELCKQYKKFSIEQYETIYQSLKETERELKEKLSKNPYDDEYDLYYNN